VVSSILVFLFLTAATGVEKARADMLIPTMMLMVTILLASKRYIEKRMSL
jgi:hypothetical protein